MIIGVISDTHGYLDPRATAALQGVALILHAGDIGAPAIVDALERIAPVTAVHGNVDAGTPLGRRYPAVQRLTLERVGIYLTHIGGRPAELKHALPEPRPDVYICGHTHVALLAHEHGVLFLNPGAAGRPRFGGGLSVALLEVSAGQASARIVPL
ncbi:MAG TPA: metallophosphoesterase family protein [Kouleothrix sp.]|nr:metallophosphoesterase family protein [Kouleothrix sp.]